MRRLLFGVVAMLCATPILAQNIQLPGAGVQVPNAGVQAGAQLQGNVPNAGVQAGANLQGGATAPNQLPVQAGANVHGNVNAPNVPQAGANIQGGANLGPNQAGASLQGGTNVGPNQAGVQAGAGLNAQGPMTFQGQAGATTGMYLTAPQMAINAGMGAVPGALNGDWRYRNIDGRWWYYQPNNVWAVWNNGQWVTPAMDGFYRNNNGQIITAGSNMATQVTAGYRGVNNANYSTPYGYRGPGWRIARFWNNH